LIIPIFIFLSAPLIACAFLIQDLLLELLLVCYNPLGFELLFIIDVIVSRYNVLKPFLHLFAVFKLLTIFIVLIVHPVFPSDKALFPHQAHHFIRIELIAIFVNENHLLVILYFTFSFPFLLLSFLIVLLMDLIIILVARHLGILLEQLSVLDFRIIFVEVPLLLLSYLILSLFLLILLDRDVFILSILRFIVVGLQVVQRKDLVAAI
jgi:hypothetical protein